SRACAAEALAEHIADAVETRLHADVPMGHYLSGGLDSSAVLGVAAKRLGHRLTAFNVQFDHADYDESAVARDTAESFGAAFRTVAVDSADFADHLEQVVWHAESIGINSNAVARYLQSRAVRDAGFKAVLSGDGADELFYGYNFHQIDYLLSGYAGDETARLATFADVQAAGKLSAAIPPWFRPARNGFASRLIGFTPAWLSIVLNSRTPLRDTLLHADLKRDVTPDLLASSLIDRLPIHDQLRDRHPVQQSMYLWCKSILCNQILFADRLDMAHSVEVRMPLLDHRLFEFARTLPVSWFFRDGEEKSLFRDAMKPYLTERVRRRVKQPFLAPPSTLQRNGKLFALIQDIVHSSRLAQLGLFDPAQLARLSKLLSDGNEADLSKLEIPLMLIATSYFLCKRFDLSIVD
ncbi:asparagine synthetase B family protein, partial [Burkholderia pseudomallei]